MATVGRRVGRAGAGREGASCQGLPSFAKEVLPGPEGRGQEVGGRLTLGRGQPKAAEGRSREGGAQGDGTERLSHPVSPASLTPQPASSFRDTAGEAHVSHVQSSYV